MSQLEAAVPGPNTNLEERHAACCHETLCGRVEGFLKMHWADQPHFARNLGGDEIERFIQDTSTSLTRELSHLLGRISRELKQPLSPVSHPISMPWKASPSVLTSPSEVVFEPFRMAIAQAFASSSDVLENPVVGGFIEQALERSGGKLDRLRELSVDTQLRAYQTEIRIATQQRTIPELLNRTLTAQEVAQVGVQVALNYSKSFSSLGPTGVAVALNENLSEYVERCGATEMTSEFEVVDLAWNTEPGHDIIRTIIQTHLKHGLGDQYDTQSLRVVRAYGNALLGEAGRESYSSSLLLVSPITIQGQRIGALVGVVTADNPVYRDQMRLLAHDLGVRIEYLLKEAQSYDLTG